MKPVSLTQSAIPVLKSAMDRKLTIPVLGHVLVTVRDGLSFGTATDLDHYLTMPVDTGTAPGIYKIIGKELVLTTLPVANFPLSPSWYSEPFLAVPIAILKASLPFVSKEESRYTLNAILLRVPTTDRQIVVSATDGHRLRIQYLTNPGGLPAGDYLIPRDTAELLARHTKGDEAYFKFLPAISGKRGEDQRPELRIVTPTFGMYSRTVSGQFPNYEAVMPRGFPHHAVVLKTDLEAAIKTVLPFADPRSTAAKLAFTPSTLTVSAQSDGYGKTASMPCTLLEAPGSSESQTSMGFDVLRFLADPSHAFGIIMPFRDNAKGDMELCLNILYLQDLVKGTATGDVYFGWKDGQHAFGVTAHDLMHGAYPVEVEAEAEEPAETEVAA